MRTNPDPAGRSGEPHARRSMIARSGNAGIRHDNPRSIFIDGLSRLNNRGFKLSGALNQRLATAFQSLRAPAGRSARALAIFTALLAVAALLTPIWAAEPARVAGMLLLGGAAAEITQGLRRRTGRWRLHPSARAAALERRRAGRQRAGDLHRRAVHDPRRRNLYERPAEVGGPCFAPFVLPFGAPPACFLKDSVEALLSINRPSESVRSQFP